MKRELERIFGANNVDVIRAEVIASGLQRLTEDLALPLVSLERSYHDDAAHHLHVNRTVDEQLTDRGISHRFGSEPLERQVEDIAQSGAKEVALVDDVIFSGQGLLSMIQLLALSGVRVPIVVAGVAIGKGKGRLESHGLEVRHVVYYSEVIDEVCERDFCPGVPLSGRSLHGARRDIGVPYIKPFGQPALWASIPASQETVFSRHCLNITGDLWEAIGQESGRGVRCCDLERLPLGAPHDETPFVEYLRGLN